MEKMNWLQGDKENIWHPFTAQLGSDDPILVTGAEGIYLHTERGKIIDGISSWWVNLHGHSHPAIAEAIYRQARSLEHVIFAGFTHPPAIALAAKLISILPHNQARIFYSDNGSTAVEVAIKMAIQYWHNKQAPRKKIVALEGAYHGDTFGAMSVAERRLFNNPFSSHLFHVDFIERPAGSNNESVLEKFRSLVERGDVAGFICEPLIQAAAGMRIYEPAILDELISIARENGVICIADEVFTGFGRTGKTFASDFMEKKPDIIALSKGLTGGSLPLGVTSCSSQIHEAYLSDDPAKTFYHGHSFTGNPLACAAALASIELLLSPKCLEKIEQISGAQLEFADMLKDHPAVLDVRTLGTVLAMDVKTSSPGGYSNEMRKTIYRYFIERGILLRPLGNVIYFLPSYAFGMDDMKLVHNAIVSFADEIALQRH